MNYVVFDVCLYCVAGHCVGWICDTGDLSHDVWDDIVSVVQENKAEAGIRLDREVKK